MNFLDLISLGGIIKGAFKSSMRRAPHSHIKMKHRTTRSSFENKVNHRRVKREMEKRSRKINWSK